MTSQRALLVQEIGKPLVLVDNHPILNPSSGQVQIKVTVAGITYSRSITGHEIEANHDCQVSIRTTNVVEILAF